MGSTVTWRNAGEAPHTVTASDGSFDSDMIPAGGSWARTFEAAGTFRYVCSFHPEMEGVVEVTAAEVRRRFASAAPEPAHRLQRQPSHRSNRRRRVRPNPRRRRRSAWRPPGGELFARVVIVGLLIGGAFLLFVRAVGGSAKRAIGAEPPA